MRRGREGGKKEVVPSCCCMSSCHLGFHACRSMRQTAPQQRHVPALLPRSILSSAVAGEEGGCLTLCSIAAWRLVQVPQQQPEGGEVWGEDRDVNTKE